MDLEYGPDYQDFTKEVQDFCKKYAGLTFTDGSKTSLEASEGSGGPVIESRLYISGFLRPSLRHGRLLRLALQNSAG